MISPIVTLSCLLAASSGRPLLEDAAERIRAHRTGDLIIEVVDAAGKPVAGAQVTVAQQRHDFLFGCNIYAFGGFWDPKHEEAYRTRFKELFNYATVPFYWANFEPVRGQPGYAKIEAMARWCRKQGITVKGHPLVWNHPAGVPAWLPSDSGAVRKLLVARVEACVRHFRGSIDTWDVVNEAAQPYRFDNRPQISNLMKKIGVRQYLLDSFHAARKANKEACLLINDYRTGDDYVRVVRMLNEDGARLYDVIGIQSHMHGGVWSHRKTWEACERFAPFNVPLHFTETTLVSGPRRRGSRRWAPTEPELEKRQAREAVMFYTTVFSHPAVTALTWWDFSDARAWQGAAAGFLRRDNAPKPIYRELHKKIRGEWWTKEQRTTETGGRVEIVAFFGRHTVTVKRPSGSEVRENVTFPRPWPPPVKKRARKKIVVTLR